MSSGARVNGGAQLVFCFVLTHVPAPPSPPLHEEIVLPKGVFDSLKVPPPTSHSSFWPLTRVAMVTPCEGRCTASTRGTSAEPSRSAVTSTSTRREMVSSFAFNRDSESLIMSFRHKRLRCGAKAASSLHGKGVRAGRLPSRARKRCQPRHIVEPVPRGPMCVGGNHARGS